MSESATDSVFFMRADNTNIVNSTGRGRNSIRITSQESWNDAIYVLDIEHMPEGCSTWPAFWTKSAISTWPAGGEIDIIEGILVSSYCLPSVSLTRASRCVGFNLNTENRATLHTSPGCLMPPDSQRMQTGWVIYPPSRSDPVVLEEI